MKCFISDRECDKGKQRGHSERSDNINKNLFFISPFGYPYDDIYENGICYLIKEIYNADQNVERADTALSLGYIMCLRICRKIMLADHIIVDLSEDNPNVYYELGLSFGLKKNIIVIRNKNKNSEYNKLFDNNFPEAIVEYDGYNSFNFENPNEYQKFFKKFKNAFQEGNCINILNLNRDVFNPDSSVYDQTTKDIILYVGNYCNYIPGLHQTAIIEIISDLCKTPSSLSNIFNNLNLQEVVANNSLTLEGIISSISNENFEEKISTSTKICIIDITNYNNNINPILYFYLGLSHSLERDVIPIVNSDFKCEIPFDIGGLFHIYYKDKNDLKSELRHILEEIYSEFKEKQKDYPYKKLWDQFMIQDINLSLLTCARKDNDKGRGNRTNIDKWDFKSIADLSFFIPQKYQNSIVNNKELESKKKCEEFLSRSCNQKELIQKFKETNDESIILENIDPKIIKNTVRSCKSKLEEIGDCVIIGSPDISDYAEVALSKIHGINAYRQTTSEKPPFIFYKLTKEPLHPRRVSSFYRMYSNKDCIGKIEWYKEANGKDYECYEFEQGKNCQTFGVLTVANNPFIEDELNRKLMIISGFTGIATYGVIQMLTNENDYKNEYDQLIKDYKYYNYSDINVLVKIRYKNPQLESNNDSLGDIRDIEEDNGIKIIDIRPIN